MIEIQNIERQDVFSVLNRVNVNGHTEKKGNLTYLSWAWAWQEVKTRFPEANFRIYESPSGLNYFHDGRTAWVKVGVTIDGIEHVEQLPVMDYKNRSIPLEQITSMNVNTSIKRCLAKACALHGLGLYIYAGEDLPAEEQQENEWLAERLAEKDVQTIKKILTPNQTGWALRTYHVADLAELTNRQFGEIMQKLKELAEKKKNESENSSDVPERGRESDTND